MKKRTKIQSKKLKKKIKRNPILPVHNAGHLIKRLEYVINVVKKRMVFIDETGRTKGEYVDRLIMYLRNMEECTNKLFNLALEYSHNVPDESMPE